MFRPQFAMPPAPQGFTWQPCLYQFDQNNIPAFGSMTLTTGQETGYIRLPLDKDASCFILMAVKLLNSGFDTLLFDPWGNQLMDDYVKPSLFADQLPPFTILESGIEVPQGASFTVRFRGQ